MRRYKALGSTPIAAPPKWFVKIARGPRKAGSGRVGSSTTRTITALSASLDGPTISAGTRDNALTSIAGRLHDGRELAELESALLEINARRCEPPLPERQVIKIAHSIYRRTPCKQTNRAAPEVLELLEEIERVLWRIGWRGMGELSARDVYVALILIARQHGTRIPAGVRISISIRALALSAAVSKPTVIKAIRRLIKAGYIRRDYAGRQGTDSGAFVLLSVPEAGRANLYHSPTGEARGLSGKTLRAPRLRWSAPGIRRLGKSAGAVIDALEAAGGDLTISELAEALHKSRPRDLRRRTIPRLEAAGVVECDGVTVSLARDWLDALNENRESASEIEVHRLDMARYERERNAFREHRHRKPDPAPTEEEMTAKRNRRRDVSHLAEAPAEPPAPPSEAVEECNESEPILGVLTPDEMRTLDVIRDFERRYGPGSFKWNQSGAKELFYSSPAGCWPSVEELERIADYVEASGGLEGAA